MNNDFELSTRFCLFNKVCVLSSSATSVTFGMENLEDVELKKKLKKAAVTYFKKNNREANSIENCPEKYTVQFEKVTEDEIKKIAVMGYGKRESESELEKTSSEKSESETALLLDSILASAVEKGATDIHIEERRIRFRVNSVLSKHCDLSVERSLELVRRIKVLSKLDLLDSRNGQDGQFTFVHNDNRIFVRVSCVPCVSAFFENSAVCSCESVVLRLLDSGRVPLSLSTLGFSESQLENLKTLSSADFGLILICGATGSGKSTTATSLLLEIAKKSCGKKIITIEDPPEYVLEGITQIRVDAKNGMDFSDALRFVFRQDPDVVFVGEIRDENTARVCLRASLTGHLVIATMHTSSFGATLVRLKDLGVSQGDISTSLLGVVMQKLCLIDGKISLDSEITISEKLTTEKIGEKNEN